ncbi:N-methylhydantoinase B/acetone carboxylase, alpha subunit [Hoeflea sp. IMCC20628]|uniref:hydantoinase B/oxoprolinase family protein n=1 Tax=Hoeflea sp. IMCC20628 TaxID=1620421 RepID=UPI00063AB08F|nr:hydantoinase B/oxoprolinase family protein [Hoeflea sp. IMCC20628]AKI02009.1 N-methylhydantoinase B/acetone carboxylase, alpha subunit [Hoeflea sp. IMCC20628]
MTVPTKAHATQDFTPDPVSFAVIKSALDAIVDEMAGTVMRTARSPIVRDVLDYSCTLCDSRGQILSQAKTVALHLGAVPDAMEMIVERFSTTACEGDVYVLNDPYAGGMHLPDIFMVKPIFHQGRLQGYSVVIAHHCDMGGRVPGSNAADSTEIFQEGLRIPPLRLFDAGKRNETLFDLIRTNVRLPAMVLGDLDAQYATCRTGERELIRLIERYGEAELQSYFDALLDYGEVLTRKSIAAWPDGIYTFEDAIDGDGFTTEPIPICCAITVKHDGLEIDFAGSSPQVRGAINSTFSFTKSSAYLAVRCALDRDVPNNAGVYRAISVTAPDHSILKPDLPAPVAARALTGYRVVDCVLGALSKIAPARLMAAGEGGNTVLSMGGYDKETGEHFVLVDMINGAWGGRANKDGIEAITNPAQNMSNLPIETLEKRYPLRIEEYSLRPDSCGAGRFRGGLGLTRTYRILADDTMLQVRADRITTPPYGVDGGLPGGLSRNILNPETENTPLPGKLTRNVDKNTVIRHEQAGGGGNGDPLDRHLEAIALDLKESKITPGYAVRYHGVVFDVHGDIDPGATNLNQSRLRAARDTSKESR